MRARIRRLVICAAFLPFISSCSDKSGTAPRTDIITVTPDQNSAQLTSGGSAIIGLRITRPVGYTGQITLSIVNVPAGVSATISPSTLDSGATSSTLTLTAAAGASSGSSPVTVRASGTGIEPQSATVDVIIGSGGAGSFTLLASPTSSIVPRGGSVSVVISILRSGGFADPVSLDVSGLPGDMIASVSPSSAISNATVTIIVGSTVRSGTYGANITGQGGGSVQSTGITITVTGIGGG